MRSSSRKIGLLLLLTAVGIFCGRPQTFGQEPGTLFELNPHTVSWAVLESGVNYSSGSAIRVVLTDYGIKELKRITINNLNRETAFTVNGKVIFKGISVMKDVPQEFIIRLAYNREEAILLLKNIVGCAGFIRSAESTAAGKITTKCEGCEVPEKILTVDKSWIDFDPKYPKRPISNPRERFVPVLANSESGEAYVLYPGMLDHDPSVECGVYSNARITIYPTKNPKVGLAKGFFQFAVHGLDPNKAKEEKQTTTLYDLSFNPGAEVLFGDDKYYFPMAPGYSVKGYGVRFGDKALDNQFGFVPLGLTIFKKR